MYEVKNQSCCFQQEGHYNSYFFVTACQDETYGHNCTKQCSARHCKNVTSFCMPTTGECEGGCQDGWTGIDCSKADVSKSGKYICTFAVSEFMTKQVWYCPGCIAIDQSSEMHKCRTEKYKLEINGIVIVTVWFPSPPSVSFLILNSSLSTY